MKLYCYCYKISTKFDSISYKKKVKNSLSTNPFESPNIDLIIFAPTIHNKILANRSYYTHKPLYSKISNSRSSLRHKKKKKKKDIAFYHRAKSNQFISEHSRIDPRIQSNPTDKSSGRRRDSLQEDSQLFVNVVRLHRTVE